MNCAETGTQLPKLPKNAPAKVVAICIGEDKPRAIAVSMEAMERIPKSFLSTRKMTSYTKGVNLCKARIGGEDENERLVFDPSTDHLASVSDDVLRRYLPFAADAVYGRIPQRQVA